MLMAVDIGALEPGADTLRYRLKVGLL